MSCWSLKSAMAKVFTPRELENTINQAFGIFLRPIRRDLVVGAEREEVQGPRPGTLGRLEVDTLGWAKDIVKGQLEGSGKPREWAHFKWTAIAHYPVCTSSSTFMWRAVLHVVFPTWEFPEGTDYPESPPLSAALGTESGRRWVWMKEPSHRSQSLSACNVLGLYFRNDESWLPHPFLPWLNYKICLTFLTIADFPKSEGGCVCVSVHLSVSMHIQSVLKKFSILTAVP